MTEQEIIQRLYKVADKGLRHVHYDRTVMLAGDYLAYVTGEGLDKMLRQFVRRESAELFKQRVDITQHITTTVVSNIEDVFRKTSRSNYRRTLEYQGDVNADGKAAALESILRKFNGELTVDGWCNTRLLELNFTDPNTWVVLEWKDFDNRYKSAQPYPFEVPAACALDFAHDPRGELTYLIAKATTPGANDRPLDRLTLYLPMRSISLDQIDDDDPRRAAAEVLGGRYWIMTEHPPHRLGFVPAMRAGYKRDPLTNGATYLASYHAAVPYLKKSIKTNSELDLTASLHAFPVVIRAQDDCDAVGCINGRVVALDGNETTCQVCGGKGKKKPTSTQEEIIVSMPSGPDQVVDLEKLLVYKSPDIGILQWQTAYVDALTKAAKEAVFASEVFTKSAVAETATGKMLDLDSVYDTLYAYGQKLSAMWEFLVTGVAKITQKDAGLYARLLVQRDAKLKGFDALMGDLKEVGETGAGPAVRQSVEDDIARVMFADEPEKYRKWQVRERFNPFSGQSEDKILFLLTSDLVPKREKILYANLGNVFDRVERAHPDFYRMEAGRQVGIVGAVTDALVLEISGNAPTPMLNLSQTGSDRNQTGSAPEPTGSNRNEAGSVPEESGTDPEPTRNRPGA